ncbi:type III polyketide synthase [Caldibacillus lycopersici]|uniref:Type III polyketide synthase n=1 Tax=Perspicuibacillus lycopersici TaxID=1325689 RepID=A0AAE3LQM0_9BACI|nr:3-oxoacyl-[acyl-carrier-protein] synthase III C-terminal domain-containing protein [Perspicuibacillus lycopersici]MCU9613659.1 type III polyketide synthase [Perspicuibacillus lycopersici]
MPKIVSIGTEQPPHIITQSEAAQLSKELFFHRFKDIERLLKIFDNGQIEKRYFVNSIDWFRQEHSFSEKNQQYVQWAIKLGKEAINNCLTNKSMLQQRVDYEEIEAIIFISTTGIATPSIEARIMNELPFSPHTKRIPIWGLGCAGGGAGLARAFEYCIAFPKAKVLVLSIELCSLSFQKEDLSKSNFIGTSLFGDGVACALVEGDEASPSAKAGKAYPAILDTMTTLLPKSLDVMGWDVGDDGLYVVFSKDIPTLVESWLKPTVLEFMQRNQMALTRIKQFVAHPGGKKVIDAYEKALGINQELTVNAREVLKNFGNMSSATIFYVLRACMEQNPASGDIGLACALGPGFSSELLLLQWGVNEQEDVKK